MKQTTTCTSSWYFEIKRPLKGCRFNTVEKYENIVLLVLILILFLKNKNILTIYIIVTGVIMALRLMGSGHVYNITSLSRFDVLD